MSTPGQGLLEIQDLCLEFRSGDRRIQVLDGLSLRVNEGEAVCLVGESGSGKTVTGLSIARLLPSPPAHYSRGSIRLQELEVLSLSEQRLREVRGGRVSYIFQDPATSLHPVIRIETQIREALAIHRPEAAQKEEVIRWLRRVGIAAPEMRARDYPHQLSGGMQQRVMIAMALASHPKLLIADEPTTALDVTIQAQIMDLLRELRRELGMSVLLITHNLGVVGEFADRVAVMYCGQIVEQGPAREVLHRPLHPYTRALLKSIPRLGTKERRLAAIPGNVPSPSHWPSGCRFHPRCPIARANCSASPPTLENPAPDQYVRCPYWNDLSGKD